MSNPYFLNPALASAQICEQDLLVFFHAQRTAGSAFRHILARAYGEKSVFCTQYAQEFKHWCDVSEQELDSQRVFAGHSDFEEKDWARKFHYTTILRHPAYRTISLYFYCRKYPNQFLHHMAINSTIEEFYYTASKKKPKYFNNVMCRRVSGQANFEAAKKNIEEKFFLVGATEEFSAFVRAFLLSQNLPAQNIPVAEHDHIRYGKFLDKKELINDILAANQEDEKLFRYFNRHYFGFNEAEYPWSS